MSPRTVNAWTVVILVGKNAFPTDDYRGANSSVLWKKKKLAQFVVGMTSSVNYTGK
jgi:hypothetical protein